MLEPKIGERVEVKGHPAISDFSGMVMRNYPRAMQSLVNGDNGANTEIEWEYLEKEES